MNYFFTLTVCMKLKNLVTTEMDKSICYHDINWYFIFVKSLTFLSMIGACLDIEKGSPIACFLFSVKYKARHLFQRCCKIHEVSLDNSFRGANSKS